MLKLPCLKIFLGKADPKAPTLKNVEILIVACMSKMLCYKAMLTGDSGSHRLNAHNVEGPYYCMHVVKQC